MDNVVHMRQLLAPVLAPESTDGLDSAALVAALVRRQQGVSADEADERTFVTKVLRALRPDVFMALPADARQILLNEVCEYLRSGLYVVILFRCAAEKSLTPKEDGGAPTLLSSATLLEDLLNLLEAVIREADAALEEPSPSTLASGSSTISSCDGTSRYESLFGVCEGLAKLAGMVGMGGVTVRELKALLMLLAQGPHWQDILRRERRHDSRSETPRAGSSAAAESGGSDVPEELSVSPTLARLRHPLLRALDTMVSSDTNALKARPPALWALGGKGSGLQMSPGEWPFAGNEYSFCTWARLHALPQPGERTYLWEYTTPAGAGVSLFMRTNPLTSGAELVVHASENGQSSGNGHQPGPTASHGAADRGQWTVSNITLMPGIWYHIAVRHGPAQGNNSSSSGSGDNGGSGSSSGSSSAASSVGRALGSVFGVKSKDRLVVLVDKLPRFEIEVPVPRSLKDSASASKTAGDPKQQLFYPTIGRDFSGQLGSVFVFKEAVSDAMLQRVHDATSGVDRESTQNTSQSRHNSSSSSSGSNGLEMRLAPDVDPDFTIGGRRVTLGSLMVSAYDPARVTSAANGGEGSSHSGADKTSMALEVHSGLHAHLIGNTFAWSFEGTDARDVIGSLGGLRALFPLLAPLLTHQPPTPRTINSPKNRFRSGTSAGKSTEHSSSRGENRRRGQSDMSGKSDDSTPPRSLDVPPTAFDAAGFEADEDAWMTNTMMGKEGDSGEDDDELDEVMEIPQMVEGMNEVLTTTSSVRFKDFVPEQTETVGGEAKAKSFGIASIRRASSSGDGESLEGGHVRFDSDDTAAAGSLLSRIDGGSEDWDDDDESNEEDYNESQGAVGCGVVNAQVSGLEVSILLQLFAKFLRGHDANCREMLRVGGVPLLAGALRRAAEKGALRRCVDKEVGRALSDLNSAVRNAPGGLGYAVDTSLLFDLRIWSLSSLTTQLSVLPKLISLVRSEPDRFVPRVHLAPLLTVLKETYCRVEASHDPSQQESLQQQQPLDAIGTSETPRPLQSWLAAHTRGPSVVHFHHVFQSNPISGMASSSQKSVLPSNNTAKSPQRRSSRFYARLATSSACAPLSSAGDNKKIVNDRYDGVATEWQLRAMLLTLIRAVLEALTKADVYSSHSAANRSSPFSSDAEADAMSADADLSYYLRGGGWSTVSAANYVAELGAVEASYFIEATHRLVAVADRNAANDSSYHQGLSSRGLDMSSVGKIHSSGISALNHDNAYGADGQHSNSSGNNGGRSSRNRLEFDVGLMLGLLVAAPNRRCVHAIGCVILDLLRDPKLPNRLVEAIARHAGGSWHGATTMLMRSMFDHPSKCDQLQALGLQLLGAMLNKTSLALLNYGACSSSSSNLGRSASISVSSTKAGRVGASMNGSGGSVRPFRPATQDGSVSGTHWPAPLVRVSSGSAGSFSLSTVERSRLESSSTTSSASSPHGFSADMHPSLWHDDSDGGSSDSVWRLQDVRASGLGAAKDEEAVSRALTEEMSHAVGSASVRAWALEGGGEAFQRSITKSLRNGLGIPSDVYGTSLECAFLSDSLVAALTLHYAIEAHSLIRERAIDAPGTHDSEPFLLTDFKQLQEYYFLPPPAQGLSRAIADELTGVPRLTNPAALAALLRMLPTLPETQQDTMWRDLEGLILKTTNLAHLVVAGQAASSQTRNATSQHQANNSDVYGGVAAAWISAVHDKMVRALMGSRYRSASNNRSGIPSDNSSRRTGARTVSFAEEDSFEGHGKERTATAVDTRDMPERTSASDSTGGGREGAFGTDALNDDDTSDGDDNENAETPAEEARRNDAFNQGARLSGDLLAWSVWLSHVSPQANQAGGGSAAPSGNSSNNSQASQAPLSIVFTAASHALKPKDSNLAQWGSSMSAFRGILSHALAQLKVCTSLEPASFDEGTLPAAPTSGQQSLSSSHSNEGWSALDMSQRRPQWNALIELTFVVAATCLQESCVSALVMRTLPEAVAKLVMPSTLAQHTNATEASTTANSSDQSNASCQMKGLLRRKDSATTGDAILALQTLELVNLLLWPPAGSQLAAATEGSLKPQGPPGRFPHQPPLVFSLLQMSLLCLASISPADPAALANADRLKHLVEWLLEQPDLQASALQAGEGSNSGSGGGGDAPRKNAMPSARSSTMTDGPLPSPSLNSKAKSESNPPTYNRRATSSVLGSVGNRLGFSSSRHTNSESNGSGSGAATPTPVDWLVLTVLHVHSSLRQAQALVFAPSTVGQAPFRDAASVASVAKTAKQLHQVLALMVSGQPDLLRNSFGPHIDAHLAALMRCTPVVPPAAATPPPPGSESDRAARVVLEQSLEWLRELSWLSQPLGAGDTVRAVVQRLGDQESELEEAVHEAFAAANRHEGAAQARVPGVASQANVRAPRPTTLGTALGNSPTLAPFPAMPPAVEPEFERRARKAKKQLIKAGEQREVLEKKLRQLEARQLAKTWTSIVTQSRRAEWSPWVEVLDTTVTAPPVVAESAASDTSGELPMPPAQWRLSDHRDCFGRRMLLQRNFVHGSHAGCSYEASRAKKMLKDEPAAESAPTRAQDEAAVMQTARNLKLFRPKPNEAQEGLEDGEGEFGDQDGDQEDDVDSDDDDGGVVAGLAAGSSSKSGAQSASAQAAAVAKRVGPRDFQSSVVLVMLGVAVPGTLVLTPYCAHFVHDKEKVAAKLAKRHAEPIAPHLLKPFTWRLDSLVEVHNRKWSLKQSAVELYFADGRDVFLDFDGLPEVRKKFWRAIKKRVVTSSSAAGTGNSGSSSGGGSSSSSSGGGISGSSTSNSNTGSGSGSGSSGSASINGSSGSPYMGSIGLLRHPPVSQKPRKVLHDSKLVEAWRSRRISNFEYLLRLNLLAGRSFNDLSQYPVFPWVVADYESSLLDLENVDNSKGQFRDLSKPIGALTEDRLESYLDRYEDMRGDPDMEPFMYGSHYSTAGYTLNFLLRQEPFTSLAIDFQMGHFDISDRLFSSVASCWTGCNSSMTDVKELIPEWYCFPQMFLNQNAWDLGTVQSAEAKRVDHVTLPPWAKGETPEQRASEFVRLSRAALESEYVSLHLHHWLDLIFGVDQRSEEKNNVFHPMSYETIADGMEDEMQRIQAANHQKHYGQVPSQLFTKAHPKRLPLNECMRPLCYAPETIDNMKFWTFPKHARPADGKPHGPVQSLSIVGERLITIYGDLTVNALRWNSMPDGTGLPFTLSHRQTKPLPGRATAKSPFALTGATGPSGAYLPSEGSKAKAKRRSATTGESATQSEESPADLGPVFGSFGVCTSVSLSGGSGMAGMLSGSGAAMASGSGGGLSSGSGHGGNGSNVGDMRLLSCGYWDGAFKCHSLDSSSLKLQGSYKGGHCGDVNVLDVGADGQTVVTGGADSTCRVWIVDNSNLASALAANDSLQVATAAKTPGSEALAADANSSSSSGSDSSKKSSSTSSSGRAATADESFDDNAGESSGMGDADGGHSSEERGLLRCVHVLYGHEAPVTALAVSTPLDLVVSGASNGHVLLHRLQAGDHVRNLVGSSTTTTSTNSDSGSSSSGGAVSLDPGRFGAVSLLVVSAPLGCVVVHCRQTLSLRVFSVNGDLLCESVANQALYAMAVTQAGDLLIAGGSKGLLEVYSIHNMACLHSKAFQGAATTSGNKGTSAADSKGSSSSSGSDLGVQSPITSLTFGKDFQYLFIGTADGEVWICTDPKIRLEMLDIAINKTFAGMI